MICITTQAILMRTGRNFIPDQFCPCLGRFMQSRVWIWAAILIGLLGALLALNSPSFRNGADAVYQNF